MNNSIKFALPFVTLTLGVFGLAFSKGENFKEVRAEGETTFVSTTFATDDWQNAVVDYRGLKLENNQLVWDSSDGYDGSANGGYLTYKVEVAADKYIKTLEVHCVGNRLGSFGKAAGASGNTVSGKVFVSQTSSFGDPAVNVVLPESTECYNFDQVATSGLSSTPSSTYYVRVMFGSTAVGEGFYYDWFQWGSITIQGLVEDIPAQKRQFVNASFSTEGWQDGVKECKGLEEENGQLVWSNANGYDGSAYGGYLTYKVEADEDEYIKELEVHCVGNRLGSFGKAAGASGNTVTGKVFISDTETFGEAAISVELPESTACYNFDQVLTDHLSSEPKTTYYVRVMFGSTAVGEGFYYDWLQWGSIVIEGEVDEIPEEYKTLMAARQEAIATLQAIDLTVYRAEQRAEVEAMIADGIAAINAAQSEEAVVAALLAAQQAIAEVKTDAEMTAEELVAAKAAAKEELASYKNAEDYREAEQQQLRAIISEGNDAIDAATDIAGVNAALAAAKAKADALKTKAQYEAEEAEEPEEPEQPEEPKKSGGCGGSIIAASAIVSVCALAGLGLLISKKRRQ